MFILFTEMKSQKDSMTKLYEFLNLRYGGRKNIFIESSDKTSVVNTIPIKIGDLLYQISADIISGKFLGDVDVLKLTDEQIEIFTVPIIIDSVACVNILFLLVVRDLCKCTDTKIIQDICNDINNGKLQEVLGYSLNNLLDISRDNDLMHKIDIYLSRIFDTKITEIKSHKRLRDYYYNVFKRLAFTYEIQNIFSADTDELLETKNNVVESKLIHTDEDFASSNTVTYTCNIIYIQNPDNLSLNLHSIFENNDGLCYDPVTELRNMGFNVISAKVSALQYDNYKNLVNKKYLIREKENKVFEIQCKPSCSVGFRRDMSNNTAVRSDTKIVDPVPSVISFI